MNMLFLFYLIYKSKGFAFSYLLLANTTKIHSCEIDRKIIGVTMEKLNFFDNIIVIIATANKITSIMIEIVILAFL